jgi:hypothetical protein
MQVGGSAYPAMTVLQGDGDKDWYPKLEYPT